MGQNPMLLKALGNQWDVAPTELRRAEAVRAVLTEKGITAHRDVEFVLKTLDSHGLFHSPLLEKGWSGKEILRTAKAAVTQLKKRITRVLKGLEPAANERERRLAANWERDGESVLKLEEEKVRSNRYQTNRGGRFIAVGYHSRRRRESEITHVLQLIDYFLEYVHRMPAGKRLDCLAAVLQAAQHTCDSHALVVDRVRWRLQHQLEAERITETEFNELYYPNGERDSVETRQRKEAFNAMMIIFRSPDYSESAKEFVAMMHGTNLAVQEPAKDEGCVSVKR